MLLTKFLVVEPGGQGPRITVELPSPQLQNDRLELRHSSRTAVLRDVDGSPEQLVDDFCGRRGAPRAPSPTFSALMFLPSDPLGKSGQSDFIVAAH
jgi:hypothetical protein